MKCFCLLEGLSGGLAPEVGHWVGPHSWLGGEQQGAGGDLWGRQKPVNRQGSQAKPTSVGTAPSGAAHRQGQRRASHESDTGGHGQGDGWALYFQRTSWRVTRGYRAEQGQKTSKPSNSHGLSHQRQWPGP